LGVGQQRGLFSFGELLVLVYNFREDKVITVQSLRGYSIFARFVELPDFTGISLEELHRRAARAGRKKVLIQALDAVKKHLGDAYAVTPETAAEAKAAVETAEAAEPAEPAKEANAAAKTTKPAPADSPLLPFNGESGDTASEQITRQIIPQRKKRTRRKPEQKTPSGQVPVSKPETEPAAETAEPPTDG